MSRSDSLTTTTKEIDMSKHATRKTSAEGKRETLRRRDARRVKYGK